jgi:DNA-binding response OmpR family regulator
MLIGQTILVAEDEPLLRLDLTAALIDVGATVWLVADAREAPRLAAAPDLTAAVLDYNLGAKTSVLVGWRLHSCGVPVLFLHGSHRSARLTVAHRSRHPQPVADDRLAP